MGYFDAATARVSDAMCDFLAHPNPIAFAAGEFRCRDRPIFQRGCGFFDPRIVPLPQLANPYHVIALRGRFGKCEKVENCQKWSKLAHSAIAIAFFLRNGVPSFQPKQCRVGKSLWKWSWKWMELMRGSGQFSHGSDKIVATLTRRGPNYLIYNLLLINLY